MKYQNPKMLLRIAQADAYAAATEYVDPQSAPVLIEEALRFERYHQHPTHRDVRPGCYTDDTQMSIAVTEVLLTSREPSSDEFAEAFFRCFKRDVRYGYSRGFQALLRDSQSARHMRELLKPNSDKNGAAMRAVPLGVIPDPARVVALAKLQASITHDTEGGQDSAAAVALMSHYAMYEDGGFDGVYDWCCRFLPAFACFRTPWKGPVGDKRADPHRLGIGMCTAHAVHTLLVQEQTLMGMLRQTIEWGGDTDSVAAIVWGIAAARRADEVLPDFFTRELEVLGNLTYGPQYLEALGQKLMLAYG